MSLREQTQAYAKPRRASSAAAALISANPSDCT
jgi:hypothetical protein